jgi:hypothetical protein
VIVIGDSLWKGDGRSVIIPGRMGRRLVPLILLLSLSSSNVLTAQGPDAFAGEWRNPNSTRGIAGANIYKEGQQWTVQLLGACTPTPCVWNPEPLVVLEAAGRAGGPPRGLATSQQSNIRRVMTFRLGEASMLVEVYSMQLAVPARGINGRSYFSVDELTRRKPTATALPPPRPRVPAARSR